jgi:prevent-host-death family protein
MGREYAGNGRAMQGRQAGKKTQTSSISAWATDAALDRIPGQVYRKGMKTISATKFKQQCLSLLDRVSPEGLIITKHGRPVAKLIPMSSDSAKFIGAL